MVEEDPANIEGGEGNNYYWGNPICTEEGLDKRPGIRVPPSDSSLDVCNVKLHDEDADWGVTLELCLGEFLR